MGMGCPELGMCWQWDGVGGQSNGRFVMPRGRHKMNKWRYGWPGVGTYKIQG